MVVVRVVVMDVVAARPRATNQRKPLRAGDGFTPSLASSGRTEWDDEQGGKRRADDWGADRALPPSANGALCDTAGERMRTTELPQSCQKESSLHGQRRSKSAVLRARCWKRRRMAHGSPTPALQLRLARSWAARSLT
jgi:hypothetical protein